MLFSRAKYYNHVILGTFAPRILIPYFFQTNSTITFMNIKLIDSGVASHSSAKEELTSLVATTVAPDNIYLTPCASTSSAEVDATALSPLLAKRRKEKSTTASHLCEQIDPEKGQVCFSCIPFY